MCVFQELLFSPLHFILSVRFIFVDGMTVLIFFHASTMFHRGVNHRLLPTLPSMSVWAVSSLSAITKNTRLHCAHLGGKVLGHQAYASSTWLHKARYVLRGCTPPRPRKRGVGLEEHAPSTSSPTLRSEVLCQNVDPFFSFVVVSWSCLNKLPQSLLLKTTEMYSLTVWRPEV